MKFGEEPQGRSGRSLLGIAVGARGRIITLGFLLLACLAGMAFFGLGFWERRAQRERRERLPMAESLAPADPEIPDVGPEVPQPFVEDSEKLSRITDGAEAIEEEALAYVFHRLATLSHEEIRQRTPTELVDINRLAQDPRGHRGEFVYLPARIDAEFLPKVIGPNPSGVQTYYEFWVIDKSRNLCQILVFEKDREYHKDEAVIVRGMFLKLYRYADRAGRSKLVPTIVARRFVPYDYPQTSVPWMQYAVGGVLLVAGAAFVIAYLRAQSVERQGRAKVRSMRARNWRRTHPGTHPPTGGPEES